MKFQIVKNQSDFFIKWVFLSAENAMSKCYSPPPPADLTSLRLASSHLFFYEIVIFFTKTLSFFSRISYLTACYMHVPSFCKKKPWNSPGNFIFSLTESYHFSPEIPENVWIETGGHPVDS